VTSAPTNRDDLPVLLTVEQAAAVLQMHPESVRAQLRAGRLPARKYGRSWRILRDELLAPTGHAAFAARPGIDALRHSGPSSGPAALITQAEAARMLECSRATVARMIARGDLAAEVTGPAGGARRVIRDGVLELLGRRPMSR
jgi:excisionase family DNA binding protein